MKIFNTLPEGNEAADIEPARYFNLAIKQIQEIEEWMREANEPAQPLLVHLDMFLHLSKRYPAMAKRRVKKLDVHTLRYTFQDWFERCKKKIPAAHRDGIYQNGVELFGQLEVL